MKRTLYFVMALALVLGFTQCKKEQPTSQTEGVHITLNVGSGNNNSKVEVDPNAPEGYATVTFENGDTIFVGYKGAYVGYLIYGGGTFSGEVAITSTEDPEPLHFYCLGGQGFTPSISGNTATVVISDQTSNYPVVSYNTSKEDYHGDGAYTSVLKNKISIMKFDVTTPSTAAISITGMYNKVTVDFTDPSDENDNDNGFRYVKDGEGVITMPGVASSGASTWAIVLPQPAMGEGVAYTSDGYTGIRPAITTPITSNQYITSDFTMTVNTAHAIINGGGNTSGWTNDGGDPWGGSGGGDNNLGGWNNGGNNPWGN